MPPTRRKFDWEIYTKDDEFVDILSMTRSEARKYQVRFPDYKLQEIGYTELNKDF